MAIIRKKPAQPPSAASLQTIGAKTPAELRSIAKDRGIPTDPLDVEKLADSLGIRVRRITLSSEFSGYLKKVGPVWEIGVNIFHHPRRQKFTIAHELAHFIMHARDQVEFEDRALFKRQDSNPMEWEANRFAGELLMPESEFRKFAKSQSNKVEDIALHFGVSALAVRVRAKELKFTGHGL